MPIRHERECRYRFEAFYARLRLFGEGRGRSMRFRFWFQLKPRRLRL